MYHSISFLKVKWCWLLAHMRQSLKWPLPILLRPSLAAYVKLKFSLKSLHTCTPCYSFHLILIKFDLWDQHVQVIAMGKMCANKKFHFSEPGRDTSGGWLLGFNSQLAWYFLRDSSAFYLNAQGSSLPSCFSLYWLYISYAFCFLFRI